MPAIGDRVRRQDTAGAGRDDLAHVAPELRRAVDVDPPHGGGRRRRLTGHTNVAQLTVDGQRADRTRHPKRRGDHVALSISRERQRATQACLDRWRRSGNLRGRCRLGERLCADSLRQVREVRIARDDQRPVHIQGPMGRGVQRVVAYRAAHAPDTAANAAVR